MVNVMAVILGWEFYFAIALGSLLVILLEIVSVIYEKIKKKQ